MVGNHCLTQTKTFSGISKCSSLPQPASIRYRHAGGTAYARTVGGMVHLLSDASVSEEPWSILAELRQLEKVHSPSYASDRRQLLQPALGWYCAVETLGYQVGSVGQSCNLAVHLENTKQTLLMLTWLSRSISRSFLLLVFYFWYIYPVNHNHFYSCRWEKLWEQKQPSRASDFAQAFPKSCSYPTVRAKMQMKGMGQALTGSWRREGPKILLSQAGIHWHASQTNRSMHLSAHLCFFSNMKGHILSLIVRWD